MKMGSEDAPNGRIVRVDVLAPRKHLFRGADAIANRLGVADWHRRRKPFVRKYTLDGANPIEPFTDEVATVDFHHDPSVVDKQQAKDRAYASAVEDDVAELDS
jgi:hypothetical protein